MYKESLHSKIAGGVSAVNPQEVSSSSAEHSAWQRLRSSESYQHHLQMNAIRARVNNGGAQEVESMARQGGTVWEKYKTETLRNQQESSQDQ